MRKAFQLNQIHEESFMPDFPLHQVEYDFRGRLQREMEVQRANVVGEEWRMAECGICCKHYSDMQPSMEGCLILVCL